MPGTIDHHTVVYEYLDGRKLMSLKQGSLEFFFGEATTSRFQNSRHSFFDQKENLIPDYFYKKKHVSFSNAFHAFFDKCWVKKHVFSDIIFFPRESFLQLVSLQRLDWGRDGLHFHDSPEDGNQGKQPVNLNFFLYSKPETKNTKICIYGHIHTAYIQVYA